MKTEDIFRMALKSGIARTDFYGETLISDYGNCTKEVLKFAELIAEHEHCRCIREAERQVPLQIASGASEDIINQAMRSLDAVKKRESTE